jgi:hypothetical protein
MGFESLSLAETPSPEQDRVRTVSPPATVSGGRVCYSMRDKASTTKKDGPAVTN